VGGVYSEKGEKVVVASRVEDCGGEWVLDIPPNPKGSTWLIVINTSIFMS
jgi:hypothetical protein